MTDLISGFHNFVTQILVKFATKEKNVNSTCEGASREKINMDY